MSAASSGPLTADHLLVLSGAGAGVRVALGNDLLIGRGEQGFSELEDDTMLSRRHAHIHRGAMGELIVEDLESANGTYLNGRRIDGPQLLRHGDSLTVGETELRVLLHAGNGATRLTPPVSAAAPPLRSPATADEIPGGPTFPPGPPSPPGPAVPGSSPAGRPPGLRERMWLAPVALLVGAAIAVPLLLSSGASSTVPATGGTPSAAEIADTAFTVYVESNTARGENRVLVARYRAGSMRPEKVASYATGGRGAADPTGTGALDADQQVVTNAAHTLLFAVNQGSDTIAVLRIARDGSLHPVEGSPFPSGGHAPTSVGLVGDTLVVANNNQDGVRKLQDFRPNYTSFRVAPDGRLTPVTGATIDVAAGTSPTQVLSTPLARLVITTELGGGIRALRVGADGTLSQAPGSPLSPPSSVYPPHVDPSERVALGIAAHPFRRLLYITMPSAPALAVYSYTADGRLRFVRAVREADAYNPCWVHVSPDGRFLYTSNADTANVSVYDIGTDPARPRQLETTDLAHAGDPWNGAVDPSGRYLFQLTQRDPATLPGDGNTIDVLRIGRRGLLSELPGSPLRLPVSSEARPVGLAVVPGVRTLG